MNKGQLSIKIVYCLWRDRHTNTQIRHCDSVVTDTDGDGKGDEERPSSGLRSKRALAGPGSLP